MKNKSNRIIAILLLCVVVLTSIFVAVYARQGCSNGTHGGLGGNSGSSDSASDSSDSFDDVDDLLSLWKKPYATESKIGVAYKLLGQTARKQTGYKDEGLARYPVYGQTLTKAEGETDEDFTALKQAILAENAYLNADPNATLSGSFDNYDKMDENGYLYLNGQPVLDEQNRPRQLYKHTAEESMYFGNVSDDEPAVLKQIQVQPRAAGNVITGLYAPAGEPIRLMISANDLSKIGGFHIYVGATLANGQANNIWLARDFNRMPVIANKMPVNADVCAYDSATKTYTCYFGSYFGGPIYIGTPTTKAAFQVEISGAVEYPHFIYGLTTEAEYTRLQQSSAPYFDLEVFDNTIRFSGPRLYADKYSYAELCEAAVLWDKIARVSKQVPTGSNSAYGIDFLFEPFVAAGAAVAFVGRNTVNCPTDWMDSCLNVENFVANGAWGNIHEFNHHFQNFGLPNGGEVTNNAVSLVEYSLFTKISAKRSLDDSTLGDWNAYTDPSRVMRILLQNTESGNPVSSLDAYATVLHSFGQQVFIEATKNGNGTDNWYRNLCEKTHYDFYYYFTEVLHQTVSVSVAAEVAERGYPMYVPVACIYQTGTKYAYNGAKRQITTVQPFGFYEDVYEFSVQSMLKMPSGFTVTNVTIGNPEHGEIVKLGEDLYRFIPAAEKTSGDIDVKISLTKDDGAFAVEDVHLVFGFAKRQKTIAERTTYYFDEDLGTLFTDVDDAVSKNYAGYTSSATYASTFNGNECAAVWWNSEGVALNAVTEYKSKIVIGADGIYRFSIRGRMANLYLSLDGTHYELAAKAGDKYNNNFNVSVQNGEYKDYALKRGQTVYIKAAVLHTNVGFEGGSFVIGMGMLVDGTSTLDDVTKRTTAYNVHYQNEPFTSDYFYEREYAVTEFPVETNQTSAVLSTNFSPWDSTTELDNLFDGNSSTFMHNKQYEYVTEETPFEMTVDLGKVIEANQITLFGRSYNTQTPTSYRLYGGMTSEALTLLCAYENEPLKNGCNQIGNFALSQFRYYKLVVTQTSANYICLTGLSFSVQFPEGQLFSPDAEGAQYYGEWSAKTELSAFGHSYVTRKGYAEFTFVGTQIAVLTKADSQGRFSVSIDGGEEVVCTADGSELLFLCQSLENGKHTVTIRAIDELEIVAYAVR